jgi:hypothetical protein
MNESDIADLLAQAENALNSVKNTQTLQPEDIANAREIVRMYEGCVSDMIKKLWGLVYNSPAKTDDNKELAHWQGMIDAYVGLILRYYQAKSVVEKDAE